MRMTRVLCLALLLTSPLVLFADEQPQSDEPDFYSYETEFLNLVYYSKAHRGFVEHTARCFENSLAFHRKLFDYTPSGPVSVFLTDFTDYGHGGTSTIPGNFIVVGIEPFDYVYDTQPANERMNWLMHHELVHVVATDQASRADERYRSLFLGKVAPDSVNPISMLYSYLTTPRWYSPRWYHEGIAVFLETWMAGGVGRSLGGYDEMVFRTMVLEDRHFYDIVGLESEGTTVDFQVGQNSYLYGTRFVTYLGLTYGPEKLIEWFKRADGTRRYFSKQFSNVYGVPLDDEWRRWIEWERQFQIANVEKIRSFPTTSDQPLTRALGSVSRPFLDRKNNRILAAVNYPGESAHIAAIDLENGRLTKLKNVTTPALYYVAFTAFDEASGKLFYTTDNSTEWRDLHELDPATGKTRMVLEDTRAGDLVVSPADQAIWGVRHANGYSSLIRIAKPYEEGWTTLLTLPYGKDIFDIDISPDGKTLSASLIEVNGRMRLVSFDVEELRYGGDVYEVLFEFENNTPANFVFSPDGKYLYGSSYYSGVSNIFRYELEAREMQALTNAETGYFRPTPLDDETLLAFRYAADGFLPVTLPIEVKEDVSAIAYLGQEVVKAHPIVKEWTAGSPMQIDLAEKKTRSGAYKPGHNLRVASLYPIVESYRDEYSGGVRLEVSDKLELRQLSLSALYSPQSDIPSNQRLHLSASYRHWPWNVWATHNASNFYDLFGPTKTSRKGSSLGFSYGKNVFSHYPKRLSYSFGASGWRGLEVLPGYQNVAATFDKYLSANASLRYSHKRRTIGGVEAERGVGWSTRASSYLVNSDSLSNIRMDFDLGLPTPIDHSSLWFRASAGHAFGDETQSFAKFYFGGFGNNYVDHQSVRRFRSFYSFPGLELNEAAAENYGKLMLEWTMPPIRFRRVGLPGGYARWAQFTLFATGLRTNMNSSSFAKREFANAGVQLDIKLVLFSNLKSTLSFGYASAFEKDARSKDEFMASLKILN